MARREDLETRLTLKDEASDDLVDYAKKLADLDGEAAETFLETEAKQAKREIRDFNKQLAATDGEEARVEIKAEKDAAQRDLAKIEGALADLRARDTTVDVDADTGTAIRELDRVESAAKDADAQDVDIDVTATGVDGVVSKLGELDGPIGGITSKLGALASPGGAVAAIGAGLIGAANAAATAALEVGELANLTGDTVEYTSRFVGVADQAGIEMKDLADIVLQMNGVLSDSPELAEQLGINLEDGRQGAERFTQVADALNTKIGDAFDRGVLGSQLFGEEGVRQVNALITRFGSLEDAVVDFDGQVFSDGDVERAIEFKNTMADLETEFKELASSVGTVVIPALQGLSGAFSVAENFGLGLGHALQEALNPAAYEARIRADELGAEWAKSEAQAARFRDRILELRDSGVSMADIIEQLGLTQNAYNIVVAEASLATREADRLTRLHTKSMVAQDLIAESLVEAFAEVADENERAAKLTKRAADAEEILTRRRNAAEAGIDDLIDASKKLRDERRKGADATYDARDAEDAFFDALESMEQVKEDAEASERDKAAAVRDSVRALDEMIVKQLQEQGVLVDSEQGQREWTNAMSDSAAYLGGPLGTEIVEHIGRVNDIPDEKVTEIQALIDQGKVAEAKALIESELSKATARPDLQITDARLQSARARLEQILGRTLNLPVNTYVPGGGGGRFSHVGSRFAAGETKVVVPGQVFTPDVPGQLASVEQSRRELQPGSSGRGAPPIVVSFEGANFYGAPDDRFVEELGRRIQETMGMRR